MVFEAIAFVFIKHPFDFGDWCVVDSIHWECRKSRDIHIYYIWKLILSDLVAAIEYYGLLQVIVEKTNILTRVCPWYDSEEIYHSNLALAEKHIGKFYCSSDKDDDMQFIVDVSTSL